MATEKEITDLMQIIYDESGTGPCIEPAYEYAAAVKDPMIYSGLRLVAVAELRRRAEAVGKYRALVLQFIADSLPEVGRGSGD